MLLNIEMTDLMRNKKLYQLSDEILSFYRQTQESKRLTNNVKGQIEFTRTQEIITRYYLDLQQSFWTLVAVRVLMPVG